MRLPSNVADPSALNALMTTRQFVLNDHYRQFVWASSFQATNPAADVGTSWLAIVMTNEPTTEANVLFCPRSYWDNGTASATIYYSGTTSSTATASFDVSALAMASADDLTAVPSATTETMAGPATADTLLSATLSTEPTLDYTTLLSGWKIVRKASDNYGGNIEIYGCLVTYKPDET